MRIGFIGLGNVGGKLASNLFNNNFDLTVFDKDNEVLNQFQKKGLRRGALIVNFKREFFLRGSLLMSN